ncbi:pentatricopeptide repeat-containing protein At2g17525, mitochondrial [Diospyros lotus]|uniref:pentatricopeptide repeat-containing protein At2g17525, mitochondrial n=1 Tax=Diospyros lotus TaxID=55363 RepID=UPI00224D6FFA|nr:pentatricopeptide repeat-containing protein At2g17525, mitochondrial [Diospyros lotus]
MPNISNPFKVPFFLQKARNIHRCILMFQSISISTTPVPTHDHIAHLILEQKSPTEALQTFRWASKLPNFAHSQSTYRALVHKLCTFRRFDAVHQLLDEMPSSIGSPPDEDIFVTIVRGLGRARMICEVIKVLDLVSKFEKGPSLKLFNSILDVLVKEDIDLAREFYRKKMMGCGVQGDEYTFGILMKGLCLTNRIDEGFKLLSVMKSRGMTPNTVIYNTLLHALCKNGKVGRARSLMNEIVKPNEVTFNILISAYCREENLVQALVLLEKSFSNEFVPDVITVTKIIEVLCNDGRVAEAVEVLERVESKGSTVDVVTYNTLIKGFCRIGKVKLAVRFLQEMEIKGCLPNVDTYNAFIRGFCESRMLDSALDMFHEMKMAGISWNFMTYDTLINGLCSVGRVGDGFKILELMEESKGGSRGCISPYNGVIYGLYRENRLDEAFEVLTKMGKLFPRAVDRSSKILGFCEEGSIKDAKRVYDQMTEEGGIPSALVYASLIHGLCRQGCVKEAFELMNEMVSRGYVPVASTFNLLINGLCQQSKGGSAFKLMEDIVRRGFLPNLGSYSPLVDAFCRKGDLQKALSLVQQMLDEGIIPDYFIWNSLVLCLCQENMWLDGKSMRRVDYLLRWMIET